MRRLRARSTASSAPPKTLWSVTAIAPSPSASAWSSRSSTVIEQSCDQFVCMCRSATIQSRSSSGTTRCAARRRRFVIDSYTSSTRSASAGKLCFAAAPAPCSARSSRRSASSISRPASAAASSGWSRRPDGAAIAAPAACASTTSRARPSSAGTKTAASRSTSARDSPSWAVRTWTRPRSRRERRRPPAERLRAEQDELPVGRGDELAHDRAQERPLRLPPFEDDDLALHRRPEQVEIDAERHHLVAPREPHGRGLRRLLARGEQRVEPGEQPLALRLAGRVAEPLLGEERRGGERAGVAEREIGEARHSRLEAVDDVEAAAGERDRQVRADAHRDAHAAAPRDRDGRAERDQLLVGSVQQGASAGGEVARPVRRRQHRDRVTAAAQLPRQPRHVLVDVVRLRPGERRDEGDTETHLERQSRRIQRQGPGPERGKALVVRPQARWVPRRSVRRAARPCAASRRGSCR